MKPLFLFAFVLIFKASQAQTALVSTDSLAVPQSFDKTYDRSCALANNGIWKTSETRQPLGWQWRRVASEFDISPEGKAVYLMSRQQSRKSFIRILSGSALVMGALPVLFGGRPQQNEFNARLGLGLGMTVAGVALIINGGNKSLKDAINNRELALWLRNRDALAAELSPEVQQPFKNIYNQETIYLGFSSFSEKYVKNGRKYPIGLFGGRIKREFEGSVQGIASFGRYKKTKISGFVIYALGAVSTIGSLFLNQNRSRYNIPLSPAYIGGIGAMALGGGIMEVATNDLRDAIHFRNRDVVRQSLMLR